MLVDGSSPRSLPYDVEADWLLLKTCNFRCPYCFYTPEELGSKLDIFGTPEQWKTGFDATGRTWLIHLTGGEPSVYPGFVELCVGLSERHFLSINSNLTNKSMSRFAQQMSPDRVHFINAALHVEERRKKASVDVFAGRARELQDAGFNLFVSLVMTSPVVEDFSKISRQLERFELSVVPKILRGAYLGKRYPTAYSSEEKLLIRGYLERAKSNYSPVLERMGEGVTIDVFSDERFLEGISDYRGRLCAAGSRFVTVSPDGTVGRCSTSETLGNILTGDVQLRNKQELCDTSYCPYFCEKYSTTARGRVGMWDTVRSLRYRGEGKLREYRRRHF